MLKEQYMETTDNHFGSSGENLDLDLHPSPPAPPRRPTGDESSDFTASGRLHTLILGKQGEISPNPPVESVVSPYYPTVPHVPRFCTCVWIHHAPSRFHPRHYPDG
eukprot:6475864-Prymnesium_polylepis.1